MKKILILLFSIFFLSANVNAAISQSGITNLKKLDNNGIIQLISGNQLTGFISDGPYQGPIVHTYYKNGGYTLIFEDKIYRGVWKVEKERLCTKKNTARNFNCVYWYTGSKDGGTYAYIIAQGKIFQQFHESKSLVQLNQEKKKAAEAKRKADAKKAEAKRKAAEAKRIADAKKVEEKRKADAKKVEEKRIADAKKADEKRKADAKKAEAKRIADAKKAEAKRIADAKKAEEKRIADAKKAEEKRIADAKKAEEKRIAEEELIKRLALIPPETALTKAQNFLSDIDDFVAKNPNEFNIMEVAMFKINTKLIPEGILNDDEINALRLFKEFSKTSSAFIEFEKKNQDIRIKNELNKINKVINNLNKQIKKLRSYRKNSTENLTSASINLIDKKIISSLDVLYNSKSLSELERSSKDLTIFLNDLNAEVIRTKKLRVMLNSEKLIRDQNISKFKTYLAENISSLTPEVMTLIIEKVEALETTKKDNRFNSKSEELKVLKKVNEEISNFMLYNNIATK